MSTLLDFEKPILELEGKVKELRSLADGARDAQQSAGAFIGGGLGHGSASPDDVGIVMEGISPVPRAWRRERHHEKSPPRQTATGMRQDTK